VSTLISAGASGLPEARESDDVGGMAPRRRASYARYVVGKVLGSLGSLVFVLIVNFFLFRVIPGDPARTLGRGRFRTQEQIDAFNATYGLDQPLPQQFLTFLKNTFTGDLGVSLRYRVPVSDLIVDRLWPTLLLVGTSTVLAMLIGIYLGMVSGWRRGQRFDNVTTGSTLTLYSMPEWWLGLLLIALFAVGAGPLPGIFPTGGLESVNPPDSTIGQALDIAWHLTLPVITLTLAYLADYSLIMRSSILDEIGEDYVVTARAKGLRDVVVRRRHAARNAMLPTTTLIALSLGSVVGGAITIETIFSIPGLGLLASDALTIPDYWVLQGTFLIASAAVIFANLGANLVYGLLDPRVRT
jgi:peptide/nickel transport system permease protein